MQVMDKAAAGPHSTANVYYAHLTPLAFLERSAYVYPDKPAIVYGDRKITYAQMQERCRRVASALRANGLQTGDRVAIISPNVVPMAEMHFAVPMAGGVLVAINIRLSADEIAYILEHSGAKFLFVDTEFNHLTKPGQVEHIVNLLDDRSFPKLDGYPTYKDFYTSGSPEEQPDWLESEYDTISINYTSGTTGRPKGVMYHHRGAYLNALGENITSHIESDAVYLWTLPMFHCNGWCYTWSIPAAGGTSVCLRKFDPEQAWNLIEKENVSNMCGAPTVLIAMANHPRAKEVKLKRPLTITTAGAPPSPTILGQMEALGIRVEHVYGLTETYGPHTVCQWQDAWSDLSPDERARQRARQGVSYVIANARTRVVDEHMNDVPADGETMGEVVMRGNNVMKGYYDNPEATATAFRGGWFHSGDLAVMHPDGYIELRDRAKDIIISGGENISTIEVEQVVVKHPAVMECAVIGVPDDYWGEVPKAFVVLKPGAAATADDIVAFCRDNMAHFKAPKYVEIGELPKTSTGKIQKFVLRDKEWAGREKRIN
ncbi:MAG TPA: acyl--CoA ligase family protein [Chloroflexota bacterium]|nr:acyl--CoA ligase family protein [Chloroflexota bacterium]